MIYADQDEQRGCVKIIRRAALSFIPVLSSEIICGCLCLFLGLWTIYASCRVNVRYRSASFNDEPVKVASRINPEATYAHYPSNQGAQSMVTDMIDREERASKLADHYSVSRHSHATVPLQTGEPPSYAKHVIV